MRDFEPLDLLIASMIAEAREPDEVGGASDGDRPEEARFADDD
jgi:hypothetical protein